MEFRGKTRIKIVQGHLREWTDSLVEKALGVYVYRDPTHGRDPYPAIRTLRAWSAQDVVFDVGANDGRTVARLQRHLPSPTIYAFEPVASTFRTLVERTADLDNVHCFQLALGAESGQETIFLNEMAAKNSLSPDWSDAIGTETVDVSTVDQVMADQGIELIHFLKIDTEGYELEVLKGAKEAFAASRIAIIQLEVGLDQRVSPHTSLDEVWDFLSPMGYLLYGVFNQCRTGKRVRPPAEWDAREADRYFPSSIHYCDAVFVRADLEDL